MAVMNVVRVQVKPGKEAEFVVLHEELGAAAMPGARKPWVVKTGERSFRVVGEWNDMNAVVNARPALIASLDKLRPLLEDLGGGRGLAEPYAGEVAFHMNPSARTTHADPTRQRGINSLSSR